MTIDAGSRRTYRIWVLADDRAGNVSQCLGVAEALGLPYEVKQINYGALAKLPNLLLGNSLRGLTQESRAHLSAPWPDMVIAAGRRTAPVARYIKNQSGQRCFLVQVMYPGASGEHEFDLIAVPNHDGLPKQLNHVRMTGAPHRVTEEKLAQAAAHWHENFSHLPKPWTALIVGGTTKNRPFTKAMAKELGQTANRMAAQNGGSLLISTSRRTGDAATSLLDEISCPNFTFKWGDDGENPYFGFLALADHIVVTGDSVSMACEACATKASVYIYAPQDYAAPKHVALHDELYREGYAKPFDRAEMTPWDHPPLNAAHQVVREIRKRLHL